MIGEVQSTGVHILKALSFILMATEANDMWQTGGHLKVAYSCAVKFAQPNSYCWVHKPFPVLQYDKHCCDEHSSN